MQGLPWQTVEECLECFFWPPARFSEWQKEKWPYSTLLLLRRDAAQCLGYNPETHNPDPNREALLWPGLMCVFAGIDLLAKFREGDGPRNSGARFKNYVREHMFPGQRHEDHVYALRNAIMHSFGLYSEYEDKKYQFMLTAGELPRLYEVDESRDPVSVHFDIKVLWYAFEKSIPLCREYLLSGAGCADLKTMIERYAFVPIWGLRVIG